MPRRKTLFGKLGDQYLATIRQLDLDQLRKNYRFVDNAEYKRIITNDSAEGMRIYWFEILLRCHLTTSTSILRALRWIDGIELAVQNDNVLTFAATLRGLIESAADTQDAMSILPLTLSRNHQRISRALNGSSQETFLVQGLEESLIHFSHARKIKKGEVTPASHRARNVRDYLAILEKGQVPKVIDCYSLLCDLAHPGASSVWAWLAAESDLEINIRPEQESEIVSALLTEFECTFVDIFMFAFNGPLITLSILNYFPVPEFHTAALLKWDFSSTPLWKKAKRDLFGFEHCVRESKRQGKA